MSLPSDLPSHRRAEARTPWFSCSWSVDGMHAATVRLAGEVDLATAGQVGEALHAALSQVRLVVLDLRDVTFIDLAGLGPIVAAAQVAQAQGCRLVVLHSSPPLLRLLELTATGSLVPVIDWVAPPPPS